MIASRTIERVHERVRQRAKQEAIDAAPTRQGAVDVELRVVHLRCDVDAWLEVELHVARPAHAKVEAIRDLENGITHLLGVQSRAVHAPEQAVVLVNLVRRGPRRALLRRNLGSGSSPPRRHGGLSVRRARYDEPMKLFQRTMPLVAEPHGQPVQQLGMRWNTAHLAEVIWRVHQAPAEMMVPDTIHRGTPR